MCVCGVCMCVHMCVHVCVCVHAFVHARVHVCVCVCACMCVCACVCVAHKKSKNVEFDFKLVIQGLVHKARGEGFV